jgi:exodeoxyribonuclease VII small subunit
MANELADNPSDQPTDEALSLELASLESASSESASLEALSFEAAQQRLEQVVHELEEGQIGLADALNRYEQGVMLLRKCYALLEQAQQRIELLSGVTADGQPITQPFDADATVEASAEITAATGPREGSGKARRPAGKNSAAKNAKITPTPDADMDVSDQLF